MLRGELARVADFVGISGEGEPHDMVPPSPVVMDLLSLGRWPLPPLEAITEVPVLRPDGTVLDQAGYDAATRILYRPDRHLVVPPIPQTPTQTQLGESKALINDMIGEFPYVDQASRANAWATLITTIVRPAILGLVPLALLDKPSPGTGAGLLTDAIAIMATGRRAALLRALRSEEEWRKQITAALLAGAVMIVIDNVDQPLASSSLSSALTASIWSDRILGRSVMVDLPQRAVWIATGNNLAVRDDIARRTYWVRMNAGVAQPWRRTGFRHPQLLAWINARRGDLLAALLTVSRAWYAAGCPNATVPMLGGFEDWTRVLGGILAHAGIPGFLENLDDLYQRVSEDTGQWGAFLNAWHEIWQSTPVTTATLLGRLDQDPFLREYLPDDLISGRDEKHYPQRLGLALRHRADTVYVVGPQTVRLVRAGADTDAKVAKWQVHVGRPDRPDAEPGREYGDSRGETGGSSPDPHAGSSTGRGNNRTSCGATRSGNQASKSPEPPVSPRTFDVRRSGRRRVIL
jgi:hypothetical protein